MCIRARTSVCVYVCARRRRLTFRSRAHTRTQAGAHTHTGRRAHAHMPPRTHTHARTHTPGRSDIKRPAATVIPKLHYGHGCAGRRRRRWCAVPVFTHRVPAALLGRSFCVVGTRPRARARAYVRLWCAGALYFSYVARVRCLFTRGSEFFWAPRTVSSYTGGVGIGRRRTFSYRTGRFVACMAGGETYANEIPFSLAR